MQAIPIFAKLPFDIATRVETALVRTKGHQLSDEVFIEFYNSMMRGIFSQLVENERVKCRFQKGLPSLVGNKMCFQVQGISPWTVEVVPLPEVFLFRLATEEETDRLVGIWGEFDVMKTMLVGAGSISAQYHAVSSGRLKIVHASASNPAAWLKDLYQLTGPAIDRKDLVRDAVANQNRMINEGLRNLGC